MLVQHAWGQGALWGSEVRQWLRGGGRRVWLRGARGEIKAQALHLCCYCSLRSSLETHECTEGWERKHSFSIKQNKSVRENQYFISWKSRLGVNKEHLNFGLDNMLLEYETSTTRTRKTCWSGLRDDVICFLKARWTKSNCIREKIRMSSLWPNHPNNPHPHTCALLNENNLLMVCLSLSSGQLQMPKRRFD